MNIKQYTNKRDGKKYYMFQLYLGKDEITGKIKKTTRRGFKTKREAELSLAKLKIETSERGLLHNQDATFEDVYKLWYVGYKETVKESTLFIAKARQKVILNSFKDMLVKNITIPYCQKVINSWANKYSHMIVKVMKNYTVSILNYAVDMKIIYDNSMIKTKVPKPKDEIIEDETKDFYTKKELEDFFKILNSMNDLKTLAMFRLLAFTGMRKGEMLALTWDDIDTKQNTVNINKTLVRTAKGLSVQTTKTKSSKRKIAIDHDTKRILLNWKLEQRRILHGLGVWQKDNNIIFGNEFKRNSYLSPLTVNNKLKAICKKHNFKLIKIHGFRHSHCTLLFESGATIQEVQYRLGHSDIQTTMNIYNHVTEKQKEKTADLFANYVNI